MLQFATHCGGTHKQSSETTGRTCRHAGKKTFLTTFLKPTGAKKLQKQYRRQAPEKKTLTVLSVPPQKKGSECSPQKKDLLSSHDFLSLFARQDG